MKKWISLGLALLMAACLAACSAQTPADEPTTIEPTTAPTTAPTDAPAATPDAAPTDAPAQAPAETPAPTEAPAEPSSSALVVYFSATGNTRAVAEALAEMQGADVYEIIAEEPYTDADLNYNDSSSRTSLEYDDASVRPAIAEGIDNIADYDVIYVGFPIWWGDMPRILYTFFDTYDLSGKTIAPFCTSGGSGISRSVRAIEELEPDATVTEGTRASASSPQSALAGWLDDIGLAE